MFFKGLSGLSSMWSQDMAIDLGTANTLVVLKDQGVVLKRAISCSSNRRWRKKISSCSR